MSVIYSNLAPPRARKLNERCARSIAEESRARQAAQQKEYIHYPSSSRRSKSIISEASKSKRKIKLNRATKTLFLREIVKNARA